MSTLTPAQLARQAARTGNGEYAEMPGTDQGDGALAAASPGPALPDQKWEIEHIPAGMVDMFYADVSGRKFSDVYAERFGELEQWEQENGPAVPGRARQQAIAAALPGRAANLAQRPGVTLDADRDGLRAIVNPGRQDPGFLAAMQSLPGYAGTTEMWDDDDVYQAPAFSITRSAADTITAAERAEQLAYCRTLAKQAESPWRGLLRMANKSGYPPFSLSINGKEADAEIERLSTRDKTGEMHRFGVTADTQAAEAKRDQLVAYYGTADPQIPKPKGARLKRFRNTSNPAIIEQRISDIENGPQRAAAKAAELGAFLDSDAAKSLPDSARQTLEQEHANAVRESDEAYMPIWRRDTVRDLRAELPWARFDWAERTRAMPRIIAAARRADERLAWMQANRDVIDAWPGRLGDTPGMP